MTIVPWNFIGWYGQKATTPIRDAVGTKDRPGEAPSEASTLVSIPTNGGPGTSLKRYRR
jgi:hypothetical protein